MYVKRFWIIICAFSKFCWRSFICGRKNKNVKERAVLFRQTLEDLGSVFIKFGQFLSLRPDLMPNEYCRELFYLLEKVPPFSSNKVVKVFLEEFNSTPEKLFRSFKSQPFASASFRRMAVKF